jgi:hypothetical protein
MTDEKIIEQLLTAYYNGDTTPEEEKVLAEFFNGEDLSEKWHTDRDLFDALYDTSRISLPEGLSERLERAIDNHITVSLKIKLDLKTKRLFRSIMSAAAVALLCIGLFFVTNRPSKQDYIADTYTNPEEAAIAVEQALLLVSAKLNQGLSPLEKVKESVEKTNEIINENVRLN